MRMFLLAVLRDVVRIEHRNAQTGLLSVCTFTIAGTKPRQQCFYFSPRQTEIAKRLNNIILQIMHYLNQEVRVDYLGAVVSRLLTL